MMKAKVSYQGGFTLVELMIAVTVLSVLLLLIATTALQIGKLFYKGVTSSQTQEAVRSVSSDLARGIQTSAPTQELNNVNGAFCIGSTRYTVTIDSETGSANHALWRDTPASLADCNTVSTFTSGKEVLPTGSRLTKFILKDTNSDKTYWDMQIGVGKGGNELFQRNAGAITGCVSSKNGGQFCDVAELKTGIYRRYR